VARQQLVVRDAVPEDVEDLLQLWAAAGGAAEQPHHPDDAARALSHLAADPDERLIVGETGGRVVAALHLRRAPISPLHTEQVVHTSFLLVLPEHRRHGYARTLLDAAICWAEEKDIHHLSAITSSSLRETNRFLARLGFGTLAHVRVAPTAVVRKKMSPPAGAAGTRNLGQLLAARRSMMRHRQGEGVR
jgi:GNAT superfamily N-acetyltransferase